MNLADLSFSPKTPEVAIKAGLKALVDQEKHFTGNTNFFVITDKGTVHANLGAPCHGRMQNFTNLDGTRACIATEIGSTRNWDKVSVNLMRPFFEYFLNRSFASRFILNKDDPEFAFRHGIVVCSDVPSALFQNVLLVSRHFYECIAKPFELFNDLVSEGYPEDFAYGIAFNSNIRNFLPSQSEVDFKVRSLWSHTAFPLWPSLETMKNFAVGDYGSSLKDDETTHYRHKATIYGGLKYCQAKGDTYSSGQYFTQSLLKDKEFAKELSAFRKPTKEKRIVDPFSSSFNTPSSEMPYVVTLSELRNVVIPFMKKKGLLDVFDKAAH
jgi:hypothetical protein